MPRAKRKSPEGQHDPTMGPKVKDAKVLRTLGSGTFGTCYAVVLDDDKTLCCAKLARPKAEVAEAAAELWREATMLQLLNRAEAIPGTSHIIRLLRFVDSSRGSPFILLELMDESLDKFLHRRGREFRGVSPTTMRSFAQQLLTGLTFLFDHGIVHCDLKPQNILTRAATHLESDTELKIADFGSAKPKEKTLTNFQIQTLWYRSPEVLIGFERPSPAIDMWSLGCILVELRTSSALLPAKPGDDELCNLMNMMEELLGSVPYEMVVASSLGIELEATLNVRSSVAPCRSLHDVIAGNEDFPLGVHPSWSPGECDLLLDLVTDLLKYRPCQRLTPAEAAKHGFFRPSTSLSDFEGA